MTVVGLASPFCVLATLSNVVGLMRPTLDSFSEVVGCRNNAPDLDACKDVGLLRSTLAACRGCRFGEPNRMQVTTVVGFVRPTLDTVTQVISADLTLRRKSYQVHLQSLARLQR